MNRFSNLSIRHKLFYIYITIVFITILTFSVIISARSSKVVERLAKNNVEHSIISAAQHITTLIDDVNARLLALQANEDVQQILSSENSKNLAADVAQLEKILREVDVFHSKISNTALYVIGRDDFPAINENQSVFSDAHMQNDSWFKSALSSGVRTRWRIRDSYHPNQSVIVASKIIHSVTDKRPLAVLRADIDIDLFTQYLDCITLADTGKIFLCSSNHIIDNQDSKLGDLLTNNVTIFRDMLPKNTVETQTITLEGYSWLIQTYPIDNSDMYLLGAVKINEFNSAHRSIKSSIFITALFLLILSLLFVLFTSVLITKPILSLSQHMADYRIDKTDVVHSESKDEIGTLYDSFNAMNATIHKLIDDIQHETEIRKIAELKALQAQITPHFLYNTLNSICALSKYHGVPDIEEMTNALSNFFMHSLSNGAEMISIENELEHVMSYVYIQKIRYRDKFDINIYADDEVKDFKICKLTLQPLVENCIYHAFDDIDYLGIIDINIKLVNDFIEITVSDNGTGDETVDFEQLNTYVNKPFDVDESIEKYGIHNIFQRIKLYFGDDSKIVFYPNTDRGLSVKITIKAIAS